MGADQDRGADVPALQKPVLPHATAGEEDGVSLSAPRLGLANQGDYARWQMACKALLVFMKAYDGRVKTAWQAWLVTRQVPRWIAQLRQEGQAGVLVPETIRGLNHALGDYDDPADLEPFEHLVHDDIGLPYRWVPTFLRMEFAAWTHTELGWQRDLVPTIPDLPADLPIGKAPREDAAYIARNVGWLYQVRHWPLVADPAWPQERRVSVKWLAKQWDQENQRAGYRNQDSRKLITGGIAQADAFLDLARW